MKALANTPKGAAPVAFRDVPEPSPAPHEALIAVHAFSLNRGELTLMRIRPEGWQPGQDVSGVVLKAAADGSGPKEGTRVVGILDWHGWAERAAVSTHRLAALPDAVSFGMAAALPVAGLTALRTLRHGDPLLGRRVLIAGAAGGVGNLAVQLAAHSGAEVTAIARGARGEPLKKLGASQVIDDIAKAQDKFWLILESAGGASLKTAIGLLEPKATIVIFGNSSGEETSISFRDFGPANNARIQSFHSFASDPEEAFGPDLALLAGLIAKGALKPEIEEHSWRDFATVAQALGERRVRGKAIFRVD
ncbi:MAG TPA: zinc-binding dehydrogenase [Stellaceae bacterium]|jgi:NADPH:quinone reductase-like Zn-dependent oxidoreductase|nr:zinc-binding dehydrogenase [Stellaceae bacterium]